MSTQPKTAKGHATRARVVATASELFADGLCAMRERGTLRADADPDTLATATMACPQGGLLLTQSRRDPGQLRRRCARPHARPRGVIGLARAHAT